MRELDVIVIGGGAAGYFGAIQTAEAAEALGLSPRILILEKSAQVLGKVKISGGGRCNVTHHCFEPQELVKNYPRGQKNLIGSFFSWGPTETIQWFESLGVELKTEKDGRMFPTTDSSQTIIDTLTYAAQKHGITTQLKTTVQSVNTTNEGYELHLKSGETLAAKKILLATGGSRVQVGANLAEQLGHSLVPAVPSLFTFEIDDPLLEGLAGIAVTPAKARIQGSKLQTHGPVLITHWGLSGPAILKLSAFGAVELAKRDYQFTLEVDWLNEADAQEPLNEYRQSNGKKKVLTRSPFKALPNRLWERMNQIAKIQPETTWGQLSKAQTQSLIQQLNRSTFDVKGKSLNKDEFVTAGGVKRNEINFKTMESKTSPGFYLAGEVIDVDGITGGFNFQNAWTTGYHAGQAIAESLLDS